MRAGAAFFLFELRRHLPLLLLASSLLLVMPGVYRLSEGDWSYWTSDWRFQSAMIGLVLVTPLLAVAMALSGWAAEQSRDTLEWLYARPLPASRLFWLRLAAILAILAAWIVLVFVGSWVRPGSQAVGSELVSSFLSWSFRLSSVGLGVALLSSALCSTSRRAASVFLWCSLLLPLALWLILPRPAAGALDNARLLSFLLYYGSILGASILGAWAAVRRAPADPQRILRGLEIALPGLVLGIGASFLVLYNPVPVETAIAKTGWLVSSLAPWSEQPDASRVVVALPLGDGAILELADAGNIGGRHYHPVVRRTDGGAVVPGLLVGYQAFAHPGRGLAVMPWLKADSSGFFRRAGWVVVDRRGRAHPVFLPPLDSGVRYQPLGWSADGSYFAWKAETGYPAIGLGITLLSADRRLWPLLRFDEIGLESMSCCFDAAWLDDERLLIARPAGPELPSSVPPPSSRTADGSTAVGVPMVPGEWAVLSTAGEVVTGPHRLPGDFLASPALVRSYDSRRGRAPLPARRGERWVLTLGAREEGLRLAVLDPRSWELRPGLPIADPRGGSLGSVADGTLVWIFPETATRARILTLPPPPEDNLAEACILEDDPSAPYYLFRGSTGPWAVWESDDRLSACNVENGEVRVVRTAAPLDAGSLEIVDGGLLTPHGRVGFDRPGGSPADPRTRRWVVSLGGLDAEEPEPARPGETDG